MSGTEGTSNETEYVSVSCQLCGSNECDQEYHLNKTGIVKCRQCNFSYINPRISTGILNKRLQEWAGEDVVDEERLSVAFDERTMALYRSYLERISKITGKKTGRLLDIGCSTGSFLVAARSMGWEVEGLEIGKASSEYASGELGLNVQNGSIYDFDVNTKYDVIVFLEVIEHLEEPQKALQKIASMLDKGGVLLLSTPNYDSLYRRVHGSKWWVINCEDEHIMFFNMGNLSRMLENTGFSVKFRLIRSIDIAGILKSFRGVRRAVHSEKDVCHSYYDARKGKEKIKQKLEKLGLLGIARSGLGLLDITFSKRFSPLYGMGEQLVVIAVKE